MRCFSAALNITMKYYVLSDIHGFCTLFQRTLRESGYFDDPEEKKILVLGDLFDRGKEAAELQDYILELMEEDRVILMTSPGDDIENLHKFITWMLKL